jgi:hypothetical protein
MLSGVNRLLAIVIASFLLLGCGGASNVPVDNPAETEKSAATLLIAEKRGKICSEFPEFVFRFYGYKKESEYRKNQYDFTINRMVIYKSGVKEEKFQEFVFADIKLYDNTPVILLDDVNFDGFSDILLKSFIADKKYKCWLWDANQAKFIPNTEIEKITNPIFDREKKLIVSLPDSELHRTQYTRVYEFVDNNPLLIKITKSYLLPDEKNVRYTISERIDNKMQITKEYDEPNEIILSFKEKLHPSLPDYDLKVYGKRKKSGGEDHTHFSARKIVVSLVGSQKLIQEIDFDETWTYHGKSLGFIIEDMNFDGYKDIRIQILTPAGPNIPYYCWLWDNDTLQFMKNKRLEGITAPRFDHDKKIITSFVRESAAHHYKFTYKYIDGIPTVIRVDERKGEIVDGQKIGHFITSELKDGKMQVIEEYFKPYE